METNDSSIQTAKSSPLIWLRDSVVARDAAWVLSAQILTALITLGVECLLFRKLSVPERGTLTAALAFQAVLLLLCDLGISLTTVRVSAEYIAKEMLAEANAVFRRALLTRLILAVGITGLAFFLTPALLQFPLNAAHRTQLVWSAAASLLSLSVLQWGVDVAQSRRQFKLYFALQVVAAFTRAWVIFIAVRQFTIYFDEFNALSAEIVLWCIAGASCLVALMTIILLRDTLSPLPRAISNGVAITISQQLEKFGRYAAAMTILTGIGGYVEVFLLQSLLKPEDTAVFDGARKLTQALVVLTTALTIVLLPRAVALSSVAACKIYVKKALLVTIPLTVLAAGGLAITAHTIVPIFWGDRYAASIAVLHWLCLAYAFNILLNPLTLALFPLKREGTIVLLNGISLLLSLAVGVMLIPKFGAIGAAWSVLAVKAISMPAYGIALFWALKSGLCRQSI
ncbi:MAG: oligosaccharide flippase family protein [Planctomycetota bacterium]